MTFEKGHAVKNTIKKKLAAAAAALALSSAGSAMAASQLISFNPAGTGAGGAVMVDLFDWDVGTILMQGLGGNVAINSAFTMKAHGEISVIKDTNSATIAFSQGGTAGIYKEFTFELSTEMRLVGAATATSFNANRDPLAGPPALTATNYFRIFADTARDSVALSGANYADGLMIAEGFIRIAPFNFTATGSDILDAAGNNDYPLLTSMTGQGGSRVIVDLTYADPGFFVSNVTSLTTDMSDAGGANLNFAQGQPSAQVAGVTFNVGSDNRNDFDCGTGAPCDMIFQSDYSSSFSDTEIPIPVPGSLALLGLGLGLIGVRLRRAHKLPA